MATQRRSVDELTNSVEQSESSARVRDGLLGEEDGRVGCGSAVHDSIGPSHPLEEENESVHRFKLFDNFVIESPELLHFDSLDSEFA